VDIYLSARLNQSTLPGTRSISLAYIDHDEHVTDAQMLEWLKRF